MKNVLVIYLITLVNSICILCKVDPGGNIKLGVFNINEYVTKNGYDIEEHSDIETEDGYLLSMYRIPPTNNNKNTPVVLLMHGLLASAENWVIGGPGRALAFQLSDKGYDVWMGNARGSVHSRKHSVLNPDVDFTFWEYSFHEIGVYDLPAKIEYILEYTGVEKIFYIGHSQGTTAFFVLASELPHFNKNIHLMVALAPVAFLSHLENPTVKLLSMFDSKLRLLSNLLGIHEFIPNPEILNLAGEYLCSETTQATTTLCANILFLIVGFDSQQLDADILPRITATIPAGGAIKQFQHFAQLINSGEFKFFDYGPVGNMDVYGNTAEPLYNIKNITAPVALFYSKNDLLVSVKDVERLCKELPNPVFEFLVPLDLFNHMDFLVAKDVNELVYSHVYSLMDKIVQDNSNQKRYDNIIIA